ncbi:MAG TPA: O-antigen ligase family protein [Pricia sp.]|nr:O-antigen ligase family protein [Pricia sp.]
MSTILRPSIESNITLFRVLLPFLFLWLFVANQRRALKLVGIIVIFISYSLLASYVSRFHTFNLVFNLYYITIFFFYFYYKEILRICGAHYIYSYLSFLFKTLVILGLIQYLFGGIYINTPETQAVNIFFWTENEFSAVLAIFVPLFFLKEKHFAKYLWIFGAVFLIVFNDAKLALLSLIVFFGGYFLIKFKLFRMRYLGFLVLGVLGIATLYFAREYSIQGKYTIEYFISRLAENIITQEPLEHIGTFNARSNAVILGIKELLNSYLLGIGPGNSDIMIDEIVVPGTEEYTALSMHNFTLQIVTEMGLFGFGMLAVFYMKVKQASEQSTYPMNLVFIFFISCIISITLLSGAWSNYFYLFILIYSIDFFKNNV